MDFFTSDLHHGHEKIIEYCDRPCAGVVEMTEFLISRWNQTVDPRDRVFVLGDFALYLRKREVEAILARLNGEKHLIQGNHDHRDVYKADGWASVLPYAQHIAHRTPVHLIHNPRELHLRDPMARGLVFHGHTHGGKGMREPPIKQEGLTFFDVGVDCDYADYRPISAAEIMRTIGGIE